MRELTLPRSGGVTAAVLGSMGSGDPHRPRLVWYGQGRTELSTASLTNWAAKTAGYLVDELGAEPGDGVLWRVRRSWQGLPLLLGCWWAGLVVTDVLPGDAAAGATEPVAAFVDPEEPASADLDVDEVVVASVHPFGLATGALTAPCRSVADAILPQADRFATRGPGPAADAPAVVTASGSWTVGQVLAMIEAAAVPDGAVVLSTTPPSLLDAVCAGALAAWAAGGALIQVDGGSVGPARIASGIATDERATATLGLDLPGLPRIG